jgi:tellurite resistance protein TerC
MFIKTLRTARRWIMIVFGFTLLGIGLFLAIPGIPGPGLAVVWAGLAILAVEFLWARRLLKRFQEEGMRLKDLLFRRKGTQPKPDPEPGGPAPGTQASGTD